MDEKPQKQTLLSESNLAKHIVQYSQRSGNEVMMSRFLRDNRDNTNVEDAMQHVGQELLVPRNLSAQRPEITSTVVSVMSSNSVCESISFEMKALGDARLSRLQKPVHFNTIVLGNNGVGKTTFIDSFLGTKFNREADTLLQSHIIQRSTRSITHNRATRTENLLSFNIDMIDTPGYGTYHSIDLWIQLIKHIVKEASITYHKSKRKHREFSDTRIHLGLYFIDGPRIKDVDKKAMLELQPYLNIIPILAKSDTFSRSEILAVKLRVIEEWHEKGIRFFDCANTMRDEVNLLYSLGPCPPFAVVASNEVIQNEKGQMIYGRRYPWGIVDVHNPDHSDFALLYKLLIGYFCYPLIENTKDIYRFILDEKNQKKQKKKKKLKEQENARSSRFGIFAGIVSVITLGAFALSKQSYQMGHWSSKNIIVIAPAEKVSSRRHEIQPRIYDIKREFPSEQSQGSFSDTPSLQRSWAPPKRKKKSKWETLFHPDEETYKKLGENLLSNTLNGFLIEESENEDDSLFASSRLCEPEPILEEIPYCEPPKQLPKSASEQSIER